MMPVGVDIETQPNPTTGKEEIWCVGVADGGGRTAFRDVGAALEYIGDRTPIFHNAGFDLSYLDPSGELWGINFRDTLTQAHLKGCAPKNLPDLTAVFLTGEPLDKTFVKERKTVTFDERPEETLQGCSKDAWATWALNAKWEQEMSQYEDIMAKERVVCRVLMDMKRRGMPVSQRKLKLARQSTLLPMADIEEAFTKIGIDPASRDDFAEWFWKGKTNLQTTPTGKLSTKGEVLREHATEEQQELTEGFIEWHQLDTYNSTYLDAWAGQEFIHANLNQTGTASWRYSCSQPNLQNVPKKGSKIVPLYQLFEAPEGYTFISADYSQIELRVLAVLTQDENLLNVYRSGGDLHSETVEALTVQGVFEKRGPEYVLREGLSDTEIAHILDTQRRFGKTLNFGIPYGLSGYGYAKRTGMRKMVTRNRWGRPTPPHLEPDEQAGSEFVEAWYARFPGVRTWQSEVQAHGEEHGYVLASDGRPLWVHGMRAEYTQIRHHAEKQCGNFPIQFHATEIMKEAMRRCPDYLVMSVHDELLYLVPLEIAQEYHDYLSEALVDHRDEIPYTIDIHMGRSWGDIKNIEDIWVSDDDDED